MLRFLPGMRKGADYREIPEDLQQLRIGSAHFRPILGLEIS